MRNIYAGADPIPSLYWEILNRELGKIGPTISDFLSVPFGRGQILSFFSRTLYATL
jgi:hypothetical protein